MQEQQLAFEVRQTPAAHYTLERAELGLHPSRHALDAVAAQLSLEQALPPRVSAIVHFDPLMPLKEVQPTPVDEEPTSGARLVIRVTTDTFDEPALTQQVGHAMFIHPLLNPDVAAAYTTHLERQHTNRRLTTLGTVCAAASIAAPLVNAPLHRETAQPVDALLGVAGAGILCIGIMKYAREHSRWRRARPMPPDVSNLEPPLRVTPTQQGT